MPPLVTIVNLAGLKIIFVQSANLIACPEFGAYKYLPTFEDK